MCQFALLAERCTYTIIVITDYTVLKWPENERIWKKIRQIFPPDFAKNFP